jgi:hypothetical protein
MYTAIKAIYEHGVITLQETPPAVEKASVVVMFLDDEPEKSTRRRQPGSILRLGMATGKTYSIPDDFNDTPKTWKSICK